MLRPLGIVVLSFILMEGISYLAHRFVYHKMLWVLHKSHHSPRNGPFEWNDLFPLFFASATTWLMVAALEQPGSGDVLAASIGISLYGVIYFFIHDVYIHRRIKRLRFKIPLLRKVKMAHAVHHRYGGEPYGLLFYWHPHDRRLGEKYEYEGEV